MTQPFDHPTIRAMERTGQPDGKEVRYPKCPICGAYPEEFFVDKYGDIAGCERCLRPREWWQLEVK